MIYGQPLRKREKERENLLSDSDSGKEKRDMAFQMLHGTIMNLSEIQDHDPSMLGLHFAKDLMDSNDQDKEDQLHKVSKIFNIETKLTPSGKLSKKKFKFVICQFSFFCNKGGRGEV